MLRINCYRCSHCQKLFENKEAYKEHLLNIVNEIVNTLNTFIKDADELGICIVQQYNTLGQPVSFRLKVPITKGEETK